MVAGFRWNRAALIALSLLLNTCVYGMTRPADETVTPALLAAADEPSIAISDLLEGLIAEGSARTEDRELAYYIVARRRVRSAADAFARAAVTGRVAQLRGINAGTLVGEVEQFALESLAFDREFRQGAAQGMLGTLYIVAPASMVIHGDAEIGLSLLESAAARWPHNAQHRLRLAEAYVSFEEDAAEEHLCWCLAHRAELRRDEQQLLDALIAEVDLEGCDDD